MSSFSTQRTNLGTLLTACTTLADVKYGRRTDFAGYPACRYFFDGVENELLAAGGGAATYRRGYRFRVEIHQEKNAKDAQKAEDALGAAVDEVMDALEDQWDLGNANDILNAPASETIKQEQSEAGNTIIIPILVTSRTLHSH